MKATVEQLENLKRRIVQADAEMKLTRAEIGKISCVHPSQVSRICRGDFKTISHNVVQICNVLGLDVEMIKTSATQNDASWSRLKASIRDIWDNTPEGAEKIARLLEAIKQLKSG